MIHIKPDCLENARGMLHGPHSTFVGWVGNTRYYLVDGTVWSLSLRGSIARCDDPDENESVLLTVRTANARRGT